MIGGSSSVSGLAVKRRGQRIPSISGGLVANERSGRYRWAIASAIGISALAKPWVFQQLLSMSRPGHDPNRHPEIMVFAISSLVDLSDPAS